MVLEGFMWSRESPETPTPSSTLPDSHSTDLTLKQIYFSR